MGISAFSRVDSTILPNRTFAVMTVSPEGEMDPETVREKLSADRALIESVAVRSDAVDPLDVPDLYKIVKSARPIGMDTLLITKGTNADNLEDLIGAEYVNEIVFVMTSAPDDMLSKCLEIARVYMCPFSVTITLTDDIDSETIKAMAKASVKCKSFLIKADKEAYKTKKKDLMKMADEARSIIRNAKLII